MENQAKIRINLDTKEMEIQGSEEFINNHSPQIQQFLETYQVAKLPKKKPGRPPKAEKEAATATTTTTTKKKVGRPRKAKAAKKATTTTAAATATKSTKKAAKATKATKATKAKKATKVKKAKKPKTPSTKKALLKKQLENITPEAISQVKSSLPERFGDFFLQLPKDTKDVDKVLAGGFFVQSKGQSQTFSTRETTRLLKTVGVKLSNPSQCVKYNEKTGRIKNVRRNRYRLTDVGAKYITNLLQGGAKE